MSEHQENLRFDNWEHVPAADGQCNSQIFEFPTMFLKNGPLGQLLSANRRRLSALNLSSLANIRRLSTNRRL